MITRARSKQLEQQERDEKEKEVADGAQPKPADLGTEPITTSDIEEDGILGSSFDPDLFQAVKTRKGMTRSEKRTQRREFYEQKKKHHLDMGTEELKQLQQSDPSLASIREANHGEAEPNKTGILEEDGLLYRQWVPHGRETTGTIYQLILPLQCRQLVLKLAHEIPMAGHLGQKKTTDRVLQRFYWPTVFQDVKELCRTCPECQKTAKGKKVRAPMVPLPIVEEPFHRIAMDIIGPLPRSRKGNRYILVICDYATRYPEAFPLRSIDAEHVAEQLTQFFSRVGVPKEILTDQGSNFTSKLLAELYKLLSIHPIRTSPYHPQTDGLVERFNQTLKAMLRRAACEDGKDWDCLIPYLLFAYREVPQASTGFSPFELVYGRQVRGPLDILKESWEASKQSVVSYVLTIQEKLANMSELVHTNMTQAQKDQKRWYDRNARERRFQIGDHVLVLLPSSTNKLLANWQGPYPVKKVISPVTYEVDMFDHQKRHRIFHVNMLRKWNTPTAQNLWVEETVEEPANEDDIILWKEASPNESELTTGEQLTTKQNTELRETLQSFSEVMSDVPGRTDYAEHDIETGTARPIRLPPYRVPQAYRETVKKEIAEMLEHGIIEPSTSEWSSPIVLVKKKDGTLRFCVDYRRLNNISQADAYPMPRIDELIDRAGQARFITTIDLTKGYWQVPLTERAKIKSAFVTPFGLYQFRVMPFGLQGAPATFPRLVDRVIQGLDDFTAAYLDDIIVYSKTWTEHLQHIQQVMERLQKAGLKVKRKKCQFGMSRCVYLGQVIGSGVVEPEASKVEAIQSFSVPETRKEVRAFLGLTGYYRKFIPDFASIAAPLSDLTRKSSPNRFKWTPECNAAFTTLKQKMCSSPVLKTPDFAKPFTLQTDASARGVGAVLSQMSDTGEEHPVGYFSRKLLPREERLKRSALPYVLGWRHLESTCLADTSPFRLIIAH